MTFGSGLDRELVERVPEGHIVHFILDAVEQPPITDFRVNDRGSGSEQYPPRRMLALLIYCYATGRFGSRTIEAAGYSDVAVRYLCANHHPDHDSICTFRVANKHKSVPNGASHLPRSTKDEVRRAPRRPISFDSPQGCAPGNSRGAGVTSGWSARNRGLTGAPGVGARQRHAAFRQPSPARRRPQTDDRRTRERSAG
jgi:hypothetical protein